MKGFIDLFNENSRQVIKKLDMEVGKTFDAHDHMSEATVEILLGKIEWFMVLLITFSHCYGSRFIYFFGVCFNFVLLSVYSNK